MGAWETDFGGDAELIEAQAPVVRPDPIVRPGEERVAPRPSPPAVRPAPPVARQAPRLPAAPQGVQKPLSADPGAQAAPQEPDEEPTRAWVGLMQKHGLPPASWTEHVDSYYKLRGNPNAPLDGVPPAIAQDLRAYAQRYPSLGGRAKDDSPPQPATPPAQPKASAAPAPSAPSASAWESDSGMPRMAPPAAPARRSQPTAGASDPSKEGWAEWIGKNISGRQDPRYRDLPSVNEAIARRPDQGTGKRMWSALVGADDDGLAKTYADTLGGDFVRTEKDANGYPIVVYRDGGQEKRAYANKPGLDYEDVTRGLVGGIPYLATGGAAGAALKNAPLLGRMAGQAVTMGGTSIAADLGAAASGIAPLDVENSAKKAGLVAGFGAAGEVVGAGVNALMVRRAAKNMIDASGKPSPALEAAMREAGLDPSSVHLSRKMMEDFAEKFARTGDARGSFVELGSEEWKIPRTLGELTQNRNQLMREQQYRGGTYGETARTRIESFDGPNGSQPRAITNALRGEIEPGRPGMAGQIAPERAGQQLKKGEIGANIRANTEAAYDAAKAKEAEAWIKVKRVDATPEALAEIEPHFQSALSGGKYIIDADVTPQAAKMARMIETFKDGKAPDKVSSIVPDIAVGDVNTMRERLLGAYQSAEQGSKDARAARKLYEAFNDWIPIAAEKSGDFATATAMRTARGISRDVHELFDGQQGTAGARIMQNVLKKTDNAEGIVNELFSVPGKSEIKGGAMTALQSLKKAYDTHLPADAAKAAWDDIRLAYFDRAIGMKTGEHMTPGRLMTSLKTARENQASLYNFLLTEQERNSLRTLEAAMSGIEKKNPNTSWSAIGVGALMRDVGKAIYAMIGGNSALGKLVGGGIYNRVDKTIGGFKANKATGSGMGAKLPELPAPSYGGFGAAYGNSRE